MIASAKCRIVGRYLARLRQGAPPLMNRQALRHQARTAVAAMISYAVARVFRLREAYWAAVTTLIVMQSDLEAALTVSVRRFTGTALGACLGT
jgi:uncharacterized membrane protein YccC